MKNLIQIPAQVPAPMVWACANRLAIMDQLRQRASLVEAENAAVYCCTIQCFLETVQQIEAWLRDPALIERLEQAQYTRLRSHVTDQVIKFGEYLAGLSTSAGQELEGYIFVKEGIL